LPGIHGGLGGEVSQAAIRQMLMSDLPIKLTADPSLYGASLTTKGSASGTLLGGNLSSIAHMIGAGLPSFDGAILMLEDTRQIGIGRVDRQLSQLKQSGAFVGLRGIAIGRFLGFEAYADRGWTLLDVLQDHFRALNVPIVGGFHFGHGENPMAVPVGVGAILDAATGSLLCGPLVR
jgi:muramoyltetrapeptide carboxypeptidase